MRLSVKNFPFFLRELVDIEDKKIQLRTWHRYDRLLHWWLIIIEWEWWVSKKKINKRLESCSIGWWDDFTDKLCTPKFISYSIKCNLCKVLWVVKDSFPGFPHISTYRVRKGTVLAQSYTGWIFSSFQGGCPIQAISLISVPIIRWRTCGITSLRCSRATSALTAAWPLAWSRMCEF